MKEAHLLGGISLSLPHTFSNTVQLHSFYYLLNANSQGLIFHPVMALLTQWVV